MSSIDRQAAEPRADGGFGARDRGGCDRGAARCAAARRACRRRRGRARGSSSRSTTAPFSSSRPAPLAKIPPEPIQLAKSRLAWAVFAPSSAQRREQRLRAARSTLSVEGLSGPEPPERRASEPRLRSPATSCASVVPTLPRPSASHDSPGSSASACAPSAVRCEQAPGRGGRARGEGVGVERHERRSRTRARARCSPRACPRAARSRPASPGRRRPLALVAGEAAARAGWSRGGRARPRGRRRAASRSRRACSERGARPASCRSRRAAPLRCRSRRSGRRRRTRRPPAAAW